jgi:hypothetical protein
MVAELFPSQTPYGIIHAKRYCVPEQLKNFFRKVGG